MAPRSSSGVLWVTGAGFSLGYGIPLTNQLLGRAREILSMHRWARLNHNSVNPLYRFLLEVEAENVTRRQNGQDPIDMEDLLTIVREAMLHPEDQVNTGGRFERWGQWDDPGYWRTVAKGWQKQAGLDPGALEFGGHPQTIYHGVCWAIQQTVLRVAQAGHEGYISWAEIYGPPAAIITTNYDLVPEALLGENEIHYGYDHDVYRLVDSVESRRDPVHGLVHTVNRQQPNAGLSVLKVHGSVGFGYCPECHEVLHFPYWPHRFGLRHRDPLTEHAWAAKFPGPPRFHASCFDDASNRDQVVRPLLAPPVREKEDLDEWPYLEPIADAALEFASSCETAVIVGTQLRCSDPVLRDIVRALDGKSIQYSGGSDGEANLRKLVPASRVVKAPCMHVVDPSPTPEWGEAPFEAVDSVSSTRRFERLMKWLEERAWKGKDVPDPDFGDLP